MADPVIGRFLGSLRLVDIVMLAVTAGGALWLVMVNIAAMSHGPARMLAVLATIGVFIRLCRARYAAPGTGETENPAPAEAARKEGVS